MSDDVAGLTRLGFCTRPVQNSPKASPVASTGLTNEAIARYSILHENRQLFAAKYLTYLPTEEELQRELQRDRRIAEETMETPSALRRGKKKRTGTSRSSKT